LSVRVEQITERRIRRALERLLYEPAFKSSAHAWSAAIHRHDTKKIFPTLLKQWFARRAPVPTRRDSKEVAHAVAEA